jgi:hypothetical protein
VSARTDTKSTGKVPTAEALLADLGAIGVVLVVDGERLVVRAPTRALTPDRRHALEVRRDALRALVAQRYRSPAECVVARSGLRPPCRRMSPCGEPVDDRPCLMPATCCLCGAPLAAGRRYLCEACSEAGTER